MKYAPKGTVKPGKLEMLELAKRITTVIIYCNYFNKSFKWKKKKEKTKTCEANKTTSKGIQKL